MHLLVSEQYIDSIIHGATIKISHIFWENYLMNRVTNRIFGKKGEIKTRMESFD